MNGSTEEVSFDELSALNHVPLDDALDALAHIQRRKVLFALLDHNPQDDSPIIGVPTEDETDTLEPVIEPTTSTCRNWQITGLSTGTKKLMK